MTSDGFAGSLTCNGASSKTNWNETKLSPFRPTDLQCALLDLGSSATINGRFIDSNNQPNDFCSTGDASYLYETDTGVENGYFEGVAHNSGKILTGTWYTPVPLAGAALYYIDVNGDIQAYFWTGLEGTSGDTIINPAQYRQSQYHYVTSYTGPAGASSDCSAYASIKKKVLGDLNNYVEDDGYYFVTSDFDFAVDDDGYNDDNANDDEDYSSDASHVYWSISILLLALLF